VVAVLFQNGNKSWFAARIGARIVTAYVDKQRMLAHNLQPTKAPAAPVEVGAIWTTPDGQKNSAGTQTPRLHTGHFFVNPQADKSSVVANAHARLGLALSAPRINTP
jgi:hypothetical protein